MGALATLLASLALAALAASGPGKLVAIGLGTFSAALGVSAYARKTARGRDRLLGAGGLAIGLAAVLIGATHVVLTVVAIARMAALGG